MESCQDRIQEKTGLRLTPHSTIGKLRWVLDQSKDAQKKAADGAILFGTDAKPMPRPRVRLSELQGVRR